jgi:ribosomal protein S18 acetylase RimI-like enzyme
VTPDAIAELEHLSSTAWPALETIAVDGFAVRFAGGVTGRSNSATALAPLPDLADAGGTITRVEALYRARGLRPRFRSSPLVPVNLAAALAARGYAAEGHASTQVAANDLAFVPDPAVTLASASDARWRAAYRAANPRFSEAEMEIVAAIHGAIRAPVVFAAIEEAGEIVALGFAVAEGGFVSLQEIATAPAARGRGLARRLVTTLLAWGRERGAPRAWLQVTAGNAPARALYARLGFATAFDTHYLVAG